MAAIVPPGKLVYGMQLPIQSQSTRYAEAWEDGCGVEELVAVARACDRAGFFYVGVCDHVAIPKPHDEVMGTEWWDTLTTLGYLAGITEQTNLLSHVYVLPYRHPLMAAKGFMTLDAVSSGRAVLGVGAGHVADEFALLGVELEGRGKTLDEAIDVVRAAFTTEYPEHHGERWDIQDAGQRPRPVRAGGPPIWVGGSSKPAMRRAAERGDGWLPQGRPEMGMKRGIQYVLEHRKAAEEDTGADLGPIDIGLLTELVYLGEPSFDVGEWCLTGDPEPIAERFRGYSTLGANQLQVRFRSRSAAELCEQIERFGAEVGPLLND